MGIFVRSTALAALLFTALGACSPSQDTQTRDAANPAAANAVVTLRPERNGGTEVEAVAVTATYASLPSPDGFSLAAPIVYAGRGGMADAVTDLLVEDQDGAVPLRIEEDPVNPGGFPYFRHWRADRAVSPPVTVSYRMHPQTELIRGPQFDFYAHGGGVSSGGMALFVLPENLGSTTWRVTWDLSDLAAGSIAASTHGEGTLTLEGPASLLIQAYYMAGPAGRYAPASDEEYFAAYWLGKTKFNAEEEMAWAGEAYDYLREFFRTESDAPYRVFVRAVDAERGLGGTALFNSFMVTVPSGGLEADAQSPRGTIFHEMGHMFVGGLSGEGPSGGPWFAEGLNVHYTRLLMLRSGLAPVEDYLESINSSAEGYYASPYRNASAAELEEIGFSSGIGAGSAQNIAYTRGSLYFAAVDSRIRAANDGEKTLDDVILPLFKRRRGGEEITRAILVDALADAAGEDEREAFNAGIVDGELIVPPSNAFGPCFERHDKTYERDGETYNGYEWARIEGTADDTCRAW